MRVETREMLWTIAVIGGVAGCLLGMRACMIAQVDVRYRQAAPMRTFDSDLTRRFEAATGIVFPEGCVLEHVGGMVYQGRAFWARIVCPEALVDELTAQMNMWSEEPLDREIWLEPHYPWYSMASTDVAGQWITRREVVFGVWVILGAPSDGESVVLVRIDSSSSNPSIPGGVEELFP